MHHRDNTALDHIETIFKLAHSGLTPEGISSVIRIDIEMVQRIIASDPMHRLVAQVHEDTLPT
jgi:hypothetical protein